MKKLEERFVADEDGLNAIVRALPKDDRRREDALKKLEERFVATATARLFFEAGLDESLDFIEGKITMLARKAFDGVVHGEPVQSSAHEGRTYVKELSIDGLPFSLKVGFTGESIHCVVVPARKGKCALVYMGAGAGAGR